MLERTIRSALSRPTNGLKFFEDHDELYWNVTGDEWDVPLGNASAQIFLPTGVTGVRATAFTGSYGARAQNADVVASDNSVNVTMLRPLGFHEGLTVVVGWDKGFVKQPGTGDLINQFLESNWPIFFPVPVFLVMFWLWYTRGRGPRVGPIAVQYAPPEGLTPAEAGTLVDDSAAMRDITATIVDLAVRGYLVIEEKEKDQMLGLIKSKEYVFHLKKMPAEWTALKPHEIILLGGLFENGARPDVELSSLQNEFYKNLPGIKDGIFDALMKRGYFQHRPDYVRSGFVGAGIVTGVFFFLAGNWLSQKTGIAARHSWSRRFFREQSSSDLDGSCPRAQQMEQKRLRACWASRIFWCTSKPIGWTGSPRRPKHSRNSCRMLWR